MAAIKFALWLEQLREHIWARVEERLPAPALLAAHEPIDCTVSVILSALEESLRTGGVSASTVGDLARAGEQVSHEMAWSLIDEVVICITEAVLRDAEAAKAQGPAALARAVMEISNRFFDGYWVFEGKTAMEQAVRFGRLVERLPTPVFLSDGDGTITYANEAFARAVGCAVPALHGRRLGDVLGTEVPLEDGRVIHAQVLAAEVVRHLEISLLAVPGEHEVEYFGSVRDRTHEVELEATKRQVVATISHELRTPLTAVLGYLQLLMEGGQSGLTGDEQRTALETMHGEADLLLRLVHDLVDYAHLDTGRYQLEPSAFLLEDAATSAARRVFGEERAGTTIAVPADLNVHADRARIEQLLTNLLTNAKRYGGDHVEVSGWHQGTTVHMRVHDNGKGIAVDRRDGIFELFYQGHDLLGFGAGIGLAVCRAVARAHGGTISLEDADGASFHVELTDALA